MDLQQSYQLIGQRIIQSECPQSVSAIEDVKRGAKTPYQSVLQIYRRMDDALSKAPEKVACDGSCNFCCHYHVYTTPIEVFSILEYMDKKLGSGKKKDMAERVAANLAITMGMTVDEHIATNVKCPFLSDAGRCDIYEVRPMACRKHHAIDRKSCEITFYDTASTVQNLMSPIRTVVSEGFMASSALASSSVKVDGARYEMNAAIHEAMSNKASFKRWKDGKTAFPSVRDRNTTELR